MSNIIKKKDNDKEYVFTCPVCGTVFTERERKMDNDSIYLEGGYTFANIISCPNCFVRSIHTELEEYDKNKDYE